MEYIYLDNQKRAKSLALTIIVLCLILSASSIFMMVTETKMTIFFKIVLLGTYLAFMLLNALFQLYLSRNKYDKYLVTILHFVQIHTLLTICTLFVGSFSSFSYCFMSGLLQTGLIGIILSIITKKANVLLVLLVLMVELYLSLFQYNTVVAVINIVLAIALMVINFLRKEQIEKYYSFLLSLLVIVMSIISFVSNYDVVMALMHYLVNHVVIAFISVMFIKKEEKQIVVENDHTEIVDRHKEVEEERKIAEVENETAEKEENQVVVEDVHSDMIDRHKEVEESNENEEEKKASRWLIKQYRDVPLEQLMDSPVNALYGISKEDAQLLKDAFNIKTVKDLATSKWFNRAEEICEIAKKEGN